MKSLNYCLLISLMLFQPTAHAGLLSSLVKLLGIPAADIIRGTKPVARSSTRLSKDGSGQDRKDESSPTKWGR